MAEGHTTVTDVLCKACSGSWPRSDHFIADLGLSKAFIHDNQFFAGWTVVLFKRHATELFHLAPTERLQLMEEVNLVAKTLAEVFPARKINYELLGNQIPHIHWHIIPRLADDPQPLDPVWLVSHTPVRLNQPELAQQIQRIGTALTKLGLPHRA